MLCQNCRLAGPSDLKITVFITIEAPERFRMFWKFWNCYLSFIENHKYIYFHDLKQKDNLTLVNQLLLHPENLTLDKLTNLLKRLRGTSTSLSAQDPSPPPLVLNQVVIDNVAPDGRCSLWAMLCAINGHQIFNPISVDLILEISSVVEMP